MKSKKNIEAFVGLLVIVGIIAILTSFLGDSKENKKQDETVTSSAGSADYKSTNDLADSDDSKALFVSPDEFKKSFNQFCKLNSFDFRISKLKTEIGEIQNTFQYSFTDNISILGTVIKAYGSVKEITMIARGDGSRQSGLDMMTMMAAIIGVADPTLSPTGRGEVLRDLKLFGDEAVDLRDHSAKIDKNGIHYFINCSESTGIWFGASRK